MVTKKLRRDLLGHRVFPEEVSKLAFGEKARQYWVSKRKKIKIEPSKFTLCSRLGHWRGFQELRRLLLPDIGGI